MFYSKSTTGFYPDDMQAEYEAAGSWPADAIEITAADEVTIRAGLATGSTVTQVNGVWIVAPEPIARVQAAQIGVLTQAYTNAIAQPVSYTSKAGVVKTYQADPSSIGNLQNMLLAFAGAQATPTGFYWVAEDNTQVPFTFADLQGLAAAMGAQGFAAFAHLQTQKAAVNSATTVAAVQAINW